MALKKKTEVRCIELGLFISELKEYYDKQDCDVHFEMADDGSCINTFKVAPRGKKYYYNKVKDEEGGPGWQDEAFAELKNIFFPDEKLRIRRIETWAAFNDTPINITVELEDSIEETNLKKDDDLRLGIVVRSLFIIIKDINKLRKNIAERLHGEEHKAVSDELSTNMPLFYACVNELIDNTYNFLQLELWDKSNCHDCKKPSYKCSKKDVAEKFSIDFYYCSFIKAIKIVLIRILKEFLVVDTFCPLTESLKLIINETITKLQVDEKYEKFLKINKDYYV